VWVPLRTPLGLASLAYKYHTMTEVEVTNTLAYYSLLLEIFIAMASAAAITRLFYFRCMPSLWLTVLQKTTLEAYTIKLLR